MPILPPYIGILPLSALFPLLSSARLQPTQARLPVHLLESFRYAFPLTEVRLPIRHSTVLEN